MSSQLQYGNSTPKQDTEFFKVFSDGKPCMQTQVHEPTRTQHKL